MKQHKPYFALQLTARILTSLWAAFWLFFAIASSIAEGMVGDIVVIAVFVLIPFAIPWFWELYGGMFLFLVGLTILIGYPFVMHRLSLTTIIITDLMLSVVPLVSGLLFLIRGLKVKKLELEQVNNPA